MGYSKGSLALVRATCLYVATKLGDLMDELVVVGGLVPSLLIDQKNKDREAEFHAGTLDLDLGISLTILGEGRYRALTNRLRKAGFSPDTNEAGNPTLQRWIFRDVTVDFLIQPTLQSDRGGRLRYIEPDFAALIAPGLHLAFQDRQPVILSGKTILGEKAKRRILVCGPGAFIILKALAFDLRGENKDAYDLFYMVRNYGSNLDDVASRLKPLLGDKSAKNAIGILKRDFLDHDGLGPRRVAEFMAGGPDEALQADVVGFIEELLNLLP